ARAAVGLVGDAGDGGVRAAHTLSEPHEQRDLEQGRRYREVIGNCPPAPGDEDRLEVGRLEAGTEEAVDRPNIDWQPREHRHPVFAHERLQKPRCDAVPAPGGLQRGLHEQDAPAHVGRCLAFREHRGTHHSPVMRQAETRPAPSRGKRRRRTREWVKQRTFPGTSLWTRHQDQEPGPAARLHGQIASSEKIAVTTLLVSMVTSTDAGSPSVASAYSRATLA